MQVAFTTGIGCRIQPPLSFKDLAPSLSCSGIHGSCQRRRRLINESIWPTRIAWPVFVSCMQRRAARAIGFRPVRSFRSSSRKLYCMTVKIMVPFKTLHKPIAVLLSAARDSLGAKRDPSLTAIHSELDEAEFGARPVCEASLRLQKP